jgi:arylsulfatase A-like enzyme
MKKIIAVFLYAGLIQVFTAPFCRAAVPMNVVIVSLNALRADHLPAYGYAKDTAPNISRFAAGSAVFERAAAQSHWTLSSLASMFTSKYVHSHGLYERGGRLSEREVTLAEALKAGGYRTAAFTGGLDMSAVYGLSQGFDVYFDDTGSAPMGSFKEIMPKAVEWLAAHAHDKFFLFVDSYDIHPPFDKPAPAGEVSGYSGALKGKTLDYNFFRDFKDGELSVDGKKAALTKEDMAYINSRYDAGITYADKFVGELLDRLGELGLSGNTMVIVTSEHGEELGDHGSFDRFGSGNLHEEAVHVPLIVKLPGKDLKGRRIPAPAQLIDLMPTILDLLGIPPAAGAQGRSLAPLIMGGEAEKDLNKYVYSEAGPHKWAVRSVDWELIYDDGNYKLSRLAGGEAGSGNAAAENPAVVYELAQKLMEWRRKTRTGGSPDDTRVALTPEMKRKLKEAGYWRSDQ